MKSKLNGSLKICIAPDLCPSVQKWRRRTTLLLYVSTSAAVQAKKGGCAHSKSKHDEPACKALVTRGLPETPTLLQQYSSKKHNKTIPFKPVLCFSSLPVYTLYKNPKPKMPPKLKAHCTAAKVITQMGWLIGMANPNPIFRLCLLSSKC